MKLNACESFHTVGESPDPVRKCNQSKQSMNYSRERENIASWPSHNVQGKFSDSEHGTMEIVKHPYTKYSTRTI